MFTYIDDTALKISWIMSPLAMTIAQKFIPIDVRLNFDLLMTSLIRACITVMGPIL